MNQADRAALLSVLELNGEEDIRRRYEADQFRKRRWEDELPVIEEWSAAWRRRKRAWLN